MHFVSAKENSKQILDNIDICHKNNPLTNNLFFVNSEREVKWNLAYCWISILPLVFFDNYRKMHYGNRHS
ncbi:MAG: hypothetical protein K0R08_1638 [Solimicrobium sp.]|jgi:hypothetical protein|nr:hypothetical protein [Solimicrobium sp.]